MVNQNNLNKNNNTDVIKKKIRSARLLSIKSQQTLPQVRNGLYRAVTKGIILTPLTLPHLKHRVIKYIKNYFRLQIDSQFFSQTSNIDNNPKAGPDANPNNSNRKDGEDDPMDSHTIKPPPPIFVRGVEDFPELCRSLVEKIGVDNFVGKSFTDRLKIQTSTPDAYRSLIHFLKEEHAEYHTYQLQQDKPICVVIRNLHTTTPISLIKSELEFLHFEVRSVTNVLHKTNKYPLPLFFIDLEPVPYSNDIFKLSSLLHTKIKVEEPFKTKTISQCVNCQDMVTQDRTVAIRHAAFVAALFIPPLTVQILLVLCRNARSAMALIRPATEVVRCTRTSNVAKNPQVTFNLIMLEISHALFKIATHQIVHIPMNPLMRRPHQAKMITTPPLLQILTLPTQCPTFCKNSKQ